MRSTRVFANAPSRSLKYQLNVGRPKGQKRRSKIRSAMKKKKEETKEKGKYLVQIGDRVRVASKYTGTVKFIGRLETKVVFPEIFVGVHLDEEVTKNSGVFHNRQYFDCPHGHGIMVKYSEVKKLRSDKEKTNITQTDFLQKPMKSKKKLPYSIRRWKSLPDSEIPEAVPEPPIKEVSVQKKKNKSGRKRLHRKLGGYTTHKIPVAKPRQLLKQKTIYNPPLKKIHQPVVRSLTDPFPKKPGGELSTSKTPISRVMPDPYPSRSALQKSFAMITDSAYSSADSGYSEYAAWKERVGKNSLDFSFDKDALHAAYKKQYEWDSFPHSNKRLQVGGWSSNKDEKIRLWAQGNATKRPLTTQRRVVYAPTSSFDPDDYEDGYYTRGRQKMERSRRENYLTGQNRSNLSPIGHTSLQDPTIGSNYKKSRCNFNPGEVKGKSRKFSQSLSTSSSESQELSLDENEITERRDREFRTSAETSPSSTQQRNAVLLPRARSYGGDLSKAAKGVTKRELQEWRKKFGDVEASNMANGLQKLQDAFAKGMNLTDTYGYPTTQGRYVKVGKYY